MKKYRLLLLASVFALASVLVACSGGDDSTDGLDGDVDGDSDGADLECEDNVCVLSGTFTESLTLTAEKKWLLRGGVFIGDDENETILTIEAGTKIYGETSTEGMLIITRGSKIMAVGTADAPIVFTSSKEAGSRARGDWGGLIINGRAPVNTCSDDESTICQSFGEGGTGWYGGDDSGDSSGALKYVRVEFAGRIISPDNELNGIAFQGVGSGTTIDFIQVHMNKDDGVEFFGGAANIKHAFISGVADDGLDWTDGWVGKAQFVVVQQYEDAGDQGVEADNNGEDNAAVPRSKPTLSNLTLIGSPNSEFSDVGILLREGTGANIHNTIVAGFNDVCLDVDNSETFSNAMSGDSLSGKLTIVNTIMDCQSNFEMDDEKDENEEVITDPWSLADFFTSQSGNRIADPKLAAPYNTDAPNFLPGSGSPALGAGETPTGAFFDEVDYIGAFDGTNDWTKGWTTHDVN